MDKKTADKDPKCPDLKDIETNDQTLNKAATWGVISFVRCMYAFSRYVNDNVFLNKL